MYDEDSGEEILCPYCDEAEDCPHRLALIDRTFCDCTSGYCANRYDEFSNLVEAAFLDRLKSGTARNCSWGDTGLDELWKCAFDQYGDDESVYIDGYVLDRLVIELFDRAGGDEYPGPIEAEGGPGCCSALTLFFAENPAAVLDTALSELRSCLIPTTQALSADTHKPANHIWGGLRQGAISMKRKATCQELMAMFERSPSGSS